MAMWTALSTVGIRQVLRLTQRDEWFALLILSPGTCPNDQLPSDTNLMSRNT
jgi:hypothetical protein